MKLADAPAFPRPSGPEPRVNQFHEAYEGMTYRQWLAGQALAGLCANSERDEHDMVSATLAVALADATIEILEKNA